MRNILKPLAERATGAISEWRQWGLPEQEQPVLGEAFELATGAKANHAFSIRFGDQYFVLKIHGDDPVLDRNGARPGYGETRQAEVAAQGMAPGLIYSSPNGDYCIMEFIAGEHPCPPIATDTKLLEDIASTIFRCQAIHTPPGCNTGADTCDYACDYATTCRHYVEVARRLLAPDRQQHFAIRFEALAPGIAHYQRKYGSNPVTCHHDLNPGNILVRDNAQAANRICLLDWDFAGPGIASMDFASLGTEFSIDTEILAGISGIGKDELAIAATIYQFMCDIHTEILSSVDEKRQPGAAAKM